MDSSALACSDLLATTVPSQLLHESCALGRVAQREASTVARLATANDLVRFEAERWEGRAATETIPRRPDADRGSGTGPLPRFALSPMAWRRAMERTAHSTVDSVKGSDHVRLSVFRLAVECDIVRK